MSCAWVLPVRSRVTHGHSPGSPHTESSSSLGVMCVYREQSRRGKMKSIITFLTCEMRALCALCVYYTSASISKWARYSRREAWNRIQYAARRVLTFIAQRKNRTEAEQGGGSPEPAMFRTCTVICSAHTRITRICLQHMHAIPVSGPDTGKTKPARQLPAIHHSIAPHFASPGTLLRTCVNQLGWNPSKELMPVASRPPSVQVDGVDVAGHLRNQKKAHNLFEQDLEFDTYIVYQHDGTRTSSTTAAY